MAGRPTLLTPELIEKALQYLDYCDKKPSLPKIEGFCLFLGIGRKTCYTWESEEGELNEQFRHILENIRLEQADKVLEGGLNNLFNATISKLILHKHGYRDEKDVTSGGEKLGNVDEIKQAAIDSAVTKHLNGNKGSTDGK